jgi:hypothetical protein
MSSPLEDLHIPNDQVTDELVPALRSWDTDLECYHVDRLLWFIFGSAVKDTVETKDAELENPLLALVGFRGEASFSVRVRYRCWVNCARRA